MSEAARVVAAFFAAQRAMYTGGPLAPVEALLHDAVVWHVPGRSAIAGDHRGRAAVMTYFERRRELTGATLEIEDHGGTEAGDTVVRLADGRATIGGRAAFWRTAGVYRVEDGRIREAWLVPLELEAFDRVWQAPAIDFLEEQP